MAVVAVCSAKGSPGVTTTALLLAALWPAPVLLVDADPAGGDVALRLPNQQGRPLDAERGLLSLLPLARRGLAPQVLFEHAQTIIGGTTVIAGLGGPEQAGAVGALWDTLAQAFRDCPVDVIVDAGRAHSQSVHLPVLRRADLVVSALRPTVAGVVHTREQLRGLGPQLRRPDGGAARLGMLIVHDARRPDEVADAAGAIVTELPLVEQLGQLALDPVGAGIFEGRPRSHPERTMLVRSARAVVATLVRTLPQPAGRPPVAGPVPDNPPQGPEPPRPGARRRTAGEPAAARESYAAEPQATSEQPPDLLYRPPEYANGAGRHGTAQP